MNKLANSAVSTAKLQAGAVTTDRLADGAVTNAKIGAAAVETPAIADGAVTPEKLSFSAVTPGDIDTLIAKIDNLAHLSARGASAYVFVSSQIFNGNLGGIAGADQKCQDLADAAGLPGTYKAWLADSDPASAPATRFTQAPNAYLRPGIGSAAPQVVADNWTDLTDGSLELAIRVTENGDFISDSFFSAWSNVTIAGAQQSAVDHCSDWTTTAGLGRVGHGEQTNSEWTAGTPSPTFCASAFHLYCFGQ